MPVKGQKRKMQIIETAKDMFLTQGFQSSHIGQVCDKLRIARGTVYQYFGNKREILYSILDEVEDEIRDIFDSDDLIDFYKSNPSNEEIQKYITDRLVKCIMRIDSEEIIIRLVFKDIQGIETEVSSRIDRFFGTITQILIHDIELLMSKGCYRKSIDPETTAKTIIGGSLFIAQNSYKSNSAAPEKETLTTLVQTVLFGII